MQERPSTLEQVRDLFLLRIREPDYVVDQPYYTTGSIVLAALVRLLVVSLILMFVGDHYGASTTWTFGFFAVWIVGIWPAWNQYQRFNSQVERLEHGTLCGACRHFNPTNQLCMVLDEHVTSEKPPCEGEAWEPR